MASGSNILLDDTEHRTPDLAAKADGADDSDGWDYWSAQFDEPVVLADLRVLPLPAPEELPVN